MATRKGGLGKGLEALFVENETDEITPSTLKIGEIEPNRGQPRHDFDETALAELADSIREHGVLQPLLVRPMPNGKYQIVAGERRWRASRMAGLTELPVIIRDLDEAAAMEVALIENLQRSDLNPMEEAMGYQELMQQHGYTQEQVAKRVGKSRPAVANALRLLALPEETARLVRDGKLSSGHARALLGLPEAGMIPALAERICQEGLSVRETERLVAGDVYKRQMYWVWVWKAPGMRWLLTRSSGRCWFCSGITPVPGNATPCKLSTEYFLSFAASCTPRMARTFLFHGEQNRESRIPEGLGHRMFRDRIRNMTAFSPKVWYYNSCNPFFFLLLLSGGF